MHSKSRISWIDKIADDYDFLLKADSLNSFAFWMIAWRTQNSED